MTWQHETFPTAVTTYKDHGPGAGVYSGSASSARGTDAEPWTVTLRRAPVSAEVLGEDLSTIVHTRTVQSRRHAEFLLDTWAFYCVYADEVQA